MVAFDKVAPVKERRIKHNFQEWLDGKIFKAIKNHDKLFRKFKKSRLLMNEELDNAVWYKVNKLVFYRKKNYFENKSNTGSWKALKYLGLPNKISSCKETALRINKTVQHDTNSNLAGNLLKMLPKPLNKFILNAVIQHYKGII